MLLKRMGTTVLMSVALLSAAQAEMYAWNAPGDGRVYSWGTPPNAPPQVQTWTSPDGSASGWSYSTPGYSMWSYPPAAGAPQFYSWSTPYYAPPMYYFYYPMYPYGGMYYYQLPPAPPPQK